MNKTLFILLMILSLYNTTASAEYCDMVGGIGADPVWIHIPKSQIYNKDYVIYLYPEGNKTYQIDRSDRLFKEDRLPNVNDEVILNVNIASTDLPQCLLAKDCDEYETERWKVIKQVDHQDSLIINGDQGRINPKAYECTYSGGRRGCWNLNSGAKLKVLSYISFDDVLFALVKLIDC